MDSFVALTLDLGQLSLGELQALISEAEGLAARFADRPAVAAIFTAVSARAVAWIHGRPQIEAVGAEVAPGEATPVEQQVQDIAYAMAVVAQQVEAARSPAIADVWKDVLHNLARGLRRRRAQR